MKIFCVECQDFVEAELVTGKEIYPHRPDLHDMYFYKCPVCGNYVGCHPGSTRPLGCIPNAELKKARQFVHEKLDPLWKDVNGRFWHKRTWWYKAIAKELGIKEYHTGWTRTVEDCRNVWRAINKILRSIENDNDTEHKS